MHESAETLRLIHLVHGLVDVGRLEVLQCDAVVPFLFLTVLIGAVRICVPEIPESESIEVLSRLHVVLPGHIFNRDIVLESWLPVIQMQGDRELLMLDGHLAAVAHWEALGTLHLEPDAS